LKTEFIYLYKKIALYGLSTETERLISQLGDGPKIVGLLDGFKESGEAFGYPIISLQQAIDSGAELILVVARPGSCKVIAKRIKEDCIKNRIEVFDVRGNDLLATTKAQYDFSNIEGYTRDNLMAQVAAADVVSLDLFDTIIGRKALYYTDVFELVDCRLKSQNIAITDFAKLRLQAEKELSKNEAPRLEAIYKTVLTQAHPNSVKLTASQLAKLEWQADRDTMYRREGMKELIAEISKSGKKVILTTDTYYSKREIQSLLDEYKIKGIDQIFVSSEYNCSKANGLFDVVKASYPNAKILHIGDDEYVDVEKASEYGIDSFRIYGSKELFDKLGAFGCNYDEANFSDRFKIGIMLSKLFSSPFQFEHDDKLIHMTNAKDVGFVACAPMILDFVFWFANQLETESFENALLCARDGYLIQKIFKRCLSEVKSTYFLTSRAAAIRAGIKTEDDIAYVDSMKFFGTEEESLLVRYGIFLQPNQSRNEAILGKAKTQRTNYQKYIGSLDLKGGKTAVFDFVAKGTTQFFIQRIMSQPLVGLYFLQLEPEFMSDKGLEIHSFYSEDERDSSEIFDNYYILETILTSPMPSVNEFNAKGEPVYANETRSQESLDCVARIQEGILEYVDDYMRLVPKARREINKALDEKLLSLIKIVKVDDEDFNNLTVEDPFFGRMTALSDVL